MADFHAAWTLSRSRYLAELEGLSAEQLNWRVHPTALTLGEAALHSAGVEAKFGAAILGNELDEQLARIASAATDGVTNDKSFPYAVEEITPEAIFAAFERTKPLIEELLSNPTEERRAVSLVSALGPVITGEGAMARLTFHNAYHQGQTYLIKGMPGFPA